MSDVTSIVKRLTDWGLELYAKIQLLAFRLPFVRVDRDSYLKKQLRTHCTPEELIQAVASSPTTVLGKDRIHPIAKRQALKHALLTATLSFALAIPNSLAVEMSLLVLDLVQFQIVVFIIAQKLMYLYGAEHQSENADNQSKAATTMLMVSAVMIGGHRLTHTLKSLTGSAARKIVLAATSRAGNRILAVNFIRQAGKWLGIETMKNCTLMTLNIVIGAVCCLISGLITFWLIYPMCKRMITHFEKGEERNDQPE